MSDGMSVPIRPGVYDVMGVSDGRGITQNDDVWKREGRAFESMTATLINSERTKVSEEIIFEELSFSEELRVYGELSTSED